MSTQKERRMFTLGPEMHTFTAIARCPATGRLGISISTSEMAVTGRCVYIKANMGAVATQSRTDPRLGQLAIELLSLGYPAGQVLNKLETSDPYIEYRQLGIVDRYGKTAVRTGTDNGDWKGHEVGNQWIVMGNGLVGKGVVQGMAEGMESSEGEDLEVRLMKSLDAGTRAGGQPKGQRSAGILVYETEGFSIINLRVDKSDKPMEGLWDIFNKFYQLRDYYKERPDNPSIGNMDDWAAARGVEI